MNRKLIGVSVFIIFIGLIVVFGQEERSFLSDMTSDDNHQLSSEEENTSSDKEQSTVPNTIREKLSNSANELKKRLEKKDAEINKLKRENAQLMEKIKFRGGRVGCFPVSEHSWKDMGEWPEYLKMINVI